MFSFLGGFLFSLSWKRGDVDAATLGCARAVMKTGRPRGPLLGRIRVRLCGAGRGGNPACRGWRPAAAGSSFSSLYTLDTYGGRQSEGNRGISVFPHFVYIVYHKIWRLSKMETGRKRTIWKNLGGAGKGCVGRGAWEGMEGRLGGCHLTFSS